VIVTSEAVWAPAVPGLALAATEPESATTPEVWTMTVAPVVTSALVADV
jgi:hypothetical protein